MEVSPIIATILRSGTTKCQFLVIAKFLLSCSLHLRPWIRGHGRGRILEAIEAPDVFHVSKQSLYNHKFGSNHFHFHVTTLNAIPQLPHWAFLKLPQSFLNSIKNIIYKHIPFKVFFLSPYIYWPYFIRRSDFSDIH